MRRNDHQFKLYCRERFMPLGFIYTDGCYARIVNDVLQTFDFHFCGGGSPDYSIHFGTRPLCMNLFYPIGGMFNLVQLDMNAYSRGLGWRVIKNGKYDFSEVCYWMEHRVLPFFLSSDRCENALQPLIEMENEMEENRRSVLLKEGRAERAFERKPFFRETVFAALKCKAYQTAISSLAYYCEIASENLRSDANRMTAVQLKNARQIEELYRLVRANNSLEIDAILSENEQESIVRLNKFGL